MSIFLIAAIFFVIAALYSSVGFGGGSSYIAILLLAGMAIEEVRLVALICNVVVVLGACINYYRADLIPWKKIIPLVLLSVPLAFIGGTVQLEGPQYKFLAGATLVIAAILMLRPIERKKRKQIKTLSRITTSIIGSCTGFISGLIGIGGGIFLSPVLNILRWETAKLISVTASVFILFNSVAGIAGQLTNTVSVDIYKVVILVASVMAGGQIGNYLNIKILSPMTLKVLTAILVGAAGIRFMLSNI